MPNLKFQEINGGVVTSPVLTDIFPYVSDPGGAPGDRQSTMLNVKTLFNIDLVEATINTASGATAATISNSAGVTWDIPVAGADATTHKWVHQIDGNDYIIIEGAGDGAGGINGKIIRMEESTIYGKRVIEKQGADIASANSITLGDGNTFELTGGTTVHAIATADWQNGALVTLLISADLEIKNNTAGAVGTAVILLNGGVDFGGTAGDTLTLRLSEIGGVQAWREVGRANM